MSNVLPTAQKKIEVRRFRLRILAMGAAVIALGGVVASLSLLPALISIRIAESSVTSSVAEASAKEDQAQAFRAQNIIDATMPLATATTSPMDILFFALAEKPVGVSVTGMTVSKESIMLSGESGSRVAINMYRDALDASGRFGSVVVPVSALVGTQDGRFTITLSGFK
jgi:hypothetical protein